MIKMRLVTQLVVVLLAIAMPGWLRAQAHRDRISGVVRSDSGRPVAAAGISVTRAPDRAIFRTTSDSAGRFEVVVDTGTGDYLVYVSVPAVPAIPAFRKRIMRVAPSDSLFVVDVQLKAPAAANAQQLAAVHVEASRPTPTRAADDPVSGGIGSASNLPSGFYGAVSPDQRGDLGAAALTIPGVVLTHDGFSVLGAPATQNSTVLNGMSFSGASLPRDAQVSVRVATTAYDPSVGGFGGAQTQVELGSGGMYSTRRTSFVLDAPQLQSTDRASGHLAPKFSNLVGGYSGSGAFLNDRLTYSYASQLSRRNTDVTTLADLDGVTLQRYGVSIDSASRLLHIATNQGIPVAQRGVGDSQVSDIVSFITRINSPEVDLVTYKERDQSAGVILYGFRSSAAVAGASPLFTPSATRRTVTTIGMLQGMYSTLATPWLLEDLRSSLSVNDLRSTPYLDVPAARVLVSSTFPDGDPGLASLGLGGAPAGAFRNRTLTWESRSETKIVLPGHAKHRIKLNADLRRDAISRLDEPSGNGTFVFNSLEDFAANSPSAFSRTLNAQTQDGGAWNGYVALSDYWVPQSTLRVLYGVRLEGNAFVGAPENDPQVEALFGMRTDRVPNTVHLSPRLGFTWTYAGDNARLSILGYPYGRFSAPAVGVLRGGIGEFRDLLSPALLVNASAAAAPGNRERSLSCVGAAVPVPDWSAYATDSASVPRDCNGSVLTGSNFGAVPNVRFFNSGYTAPRSWRANLSWASNLKGMFYSVDALYSLGLTQPGQNDLNFSNVSQLVLADEGRPIFVAPGSIVSSTGALTWNGSRRVATYGSVMEKLSAFSSRASQITAHMSPDMSSFRSLVWTLSYTLSRARSERNGFDGSTFGSPLSSTWYRADADVRHMIIASIGHQFRSASVAVFGRFASGLPFTPMVGSDVNGDGLANDRAFVFDPRTATDPVLARALRSLVDGATANTRGCLERQFGMPAAANSCEGPWTADLRVQLGLSPRVLSSLTGGRLSTVNVSISNPLGGLDQLLHGTDLRGWGNPAMPDPILYQVRGFDAATSRFEYQVNPRFGDTRPWNNASRSPFRVSLDARLDLSTRTEVQQLDRFLRPGRNGSPGQKLTSAELKRRYARNVPDLYRAILEESDSLLLSAPQMRALSSRQDGFAPRADSAWTLLATWMAGLPDRFDAAAVLARQEETTDAVWELWRQELRSQLPGILNPLQLQMIPSEATLLMKSEVPVKGLRIYMSGP